MSRYHLIISDGNGKIVGQVDTGSQERRNEIANNLPDGLKIKVEREVPDEANLGNSIEKLSGNNVEWDQRLLQLL